MTKIMNVVALGAAMAFAVVTPCAFAQDDLDDLLKDLENETKAKTSRSSTALKTRSFRSRRARNFSALRPNQRNSFPSKAQITTTSSTCWGWMSIESC